MALRISIHSIGNSTCSPNINDRRGEVQNHVIPRVENVTFFRNEKCYIQFLIFYRIGLKVYYTSNHCERKIHIKKLHHTRYLANKLEFTEVVKRVRPRFRECSGQVEAEVVSKIH